MLSSRKQNISTETLAQNPRSQNDVLLSEGENKQLYPPVKGSDTEAWFPPEIVCVCVWPKKGKSARKENWAR